jgi:hypothetical protein
MSRRLKLKPLSILLLTAKFPEGLRVRAWNGIT